MFVLDVVELVLPPLPLLDDWFSSTAVSGTSSNGSPSAPLAIAGIASAITAATTPKARLPTLLDKVFSSCFERIGSSTFMTVKTFLKPNQFVISNVDFSAAKATVD